MPGREVLQEVVLCKRSTEFDAGLLSRRLKLPRALTGGCGDHGLQQHIRRIVSADWIFTDR